MGDLEWECTVCLCPIKLSRNLIVSYPLRTLNKNEILKEANGKMFLFGAEFASDRVCRWPRCPGIVDTCEPVKSPFMLIEMLLSTSMTTTCSSHKIFKRRAKALIRLRVCAGWSEALLVAHTTLL